MEKPAQTLLPLHSLIQRRWSPRAFSSRHLEPETLHTILEAARWAASSFNEQPWRYIVATQENPAEFDRMLQCLVERNQAWAKGAPVLMLSMAKQHFTHSGQENRAARHDVGASSATLTLQALELGVFVHQMGGILPDKIRETYQIPEEFEPVAALALGYPGDLESLPEQFRAAEEAARTRKPLSEIIFASTWEQPATDENPAPGAS